MKKIINLISGGGSTNLQILQAESIGGNLHGLTETVAIISSVAEALGIQKAKNLGFSERCIHIADPSKGNLANQLLEIFDHYKPDFFHQLGWMPLTPKTVLKKYQGLNQHLGPGGKWMYGVRRVYAHIRFCQEVGEARPIPIFCQYVGWEYDEGAIIHVKFVDIKLDDDPEQVAKKLLPIEHEVQIKGRWCFATNEFNAQLVPKITLNNFEEGLLFRVKEEARDKYPPD